MLSSKLIIGKVFHNVLYKKNTLRILDSNTVDINPLPLYHIYGYP